MRPPLFLIKCRNVEQDLISGEFVLYQSGLHWIVLVGPCFAAFVLGIAGLSMLMEESWFAVFALLLIAGITMLSGYLRRTMRLSSEVRSNSKLSE